MYAGARINWRCTRRFRGRCSPGSINHGGGAELESYLATRIRCPRSSLSPVRAIRHLGPARIPFFSAAIFAPALVLYGPSPESHGPGGRWRRWR
jgi:hypothetical protein